MPSTHTSLHFHIVFSTKNREPILPGEHLGKIHAYLGGIIRNLDGVPHEVGGIRDHVHLAVGLKATHRLSECMQVLKSKSSAWMKTEIGVKDFEWQVGYGAFTFGAPDLSGVRSYIEHQEQHHREKTYQDEYVAFLERGMVEYKPEFLW